MYDTRNTYAHDQLQVGDPSASASNTRASIDSNVSVFPLTDEAKQLINATLLETESTFKVIFAGEAIYKPEKGLLNKSKKAYFVLTNNQILFYKNSQKARSEIDMFDQVQKPKKSIDKDRVFLNLSSIYAVHAIITAAYTFRIEYFHPQSSQPQHHIITAVSTEECKQWIQAIRKAVSVHHSRINSVSLSERYTVIDRLTKQSDNLLNSDDIKIYKIMFKEKRFKVGSDTPKEVFLPMILAIGKLSFYFLPVNALDDEYLKMVERDRFGLLSILSIKFENLDDTIVLEVKQVNKNNRQLVFASVFCQEIILSLQRAVDSIFKNSCLFTANVPSDIKNTHIIPFQIPVDPEDEISGRDDEETHRFSTTLRAFTAAMNLNKSRYNYTIVGPPKFKIFKLLPPHEICGTPSTYQKYEILALFKTLQVNNIFVEVCFANCSLEELETWKIQAKQGWTENTTLRDENILANEIHDLLTGLKFLRKLDLTNCSIGKPTSDHPIRRYSALSTVGTVMRAGKTNLSRISFGHNHMSETDLNKLIRGIKEHKKSIKELYLNDCGLEKDMVELVLKTLFEKSPEQVLQLDLSTNVKGGIDLDPTLIQKMIPAFKRLEILRMRGYNLLSMNYDFHLENSHLIELDIGGSKLTSEVISRVCSWIQTPSFLSIETLGLSDCNLNGKNVYDILQSITQSGNRDMHLNLEGNPIMKDVMHLPKLHSSILQGEGPRSVSFARIEWDDSTLREFIDCLRDNQNFTHLNLSDIVMRDTTEISEDTVRMLTSLFERNNCLVELELNLKYSQAPQSPFERSQPKPLISDAIVNSLVGLRHNCTLRQLDISGLNFEDAGALALSRVLKTNRTLQSISIDNNNISIEGYRKLIKVIEENATQVTKIPIPRNDLRFQIRYLAFRIEELIIAENEAQFFLIHTTASDTKKSKKHELEMVIQERRTSELALRNLESVIHSLMVAIGKNSREHEEQNYRNMEFQLQAQNAAQELAIAQVRLQQGRAVSSMSGTNLSAVGVHSRTRNPSSSNASTTSSTNSSFQNLGSISRRDSYQAGSNYAASNLSSPTPYHYQQQQQMEARMYMSRNNIISEEMILHHKPHSHDNNGSGGGHILQSPLTPSMEYPDPYYRQSESSDINFVDDPGFISDFGYADDYEQGLVESTDFIVNHHLEHRKTTSVDHDSIWNEDQLVEKLNRGLYLPPDSRD
ncbi:hypothetical protein BDF21DRAFT_341771 [Thamnidium elegans]|nr:hypothetical protein BDF21DRAFT_341771 [Thamnidium elegans]